MTFDEMLDDDLGGVFFDKEEFNIEVHLNTEAEPLIGIFDEKTEVIFDSSSEYGELSAFEPSVLLRLDDADKINYESEITINNLSYKLREKDKELDTVRLYLERMR